MNKKYYMAKLNGINEIIKGINHYLETHASEELIQEALARITRSSFHLVRSVFDVVSVNTILNSIQGNGSLTNSFFSYDSDHSLLSFICDHRNHLLDFNVPSN